MDTTALAPWKRHLMLAAGLLLALSSLAHSFLGWKQLVPALITAGVPGEIVGALAAGWHFGGVAMAAFAGIVLLTWRRSRSGGAGGLGSIRIIAAAYILFGTGAFVLRSFEPFFMIFILPGVALAAAAWGGVRSRTE